MWVLFRAESFADAIEVYKGMLSFGNINFGQLATVVGTEGDVNLPGILDYAYIITALTALLYVVFGQKNSVYRLERFEPSKKTAAATAVMFVLALLCLSRESVFISTFKRRLL